MNYFLITAHDEFTDINSEGKWHTGCCNQQYYSNPDIIESIAKASTYGHVKLTKSSLIIRSNQNLKYWSDYIHDTLKCNLFHVMKFNIINDYDSLTGYAYKDAWNWLKESRKDEIEKNTCKSESKFGFGFEKCENV